MSSHEQSARRRKLSDAAEKSLASGVLIGMSVFSFTMVAQALGQADNEIRHVSTFEPTTGSAEDYQPMNTATVALVMGGLSGIVGGSLTYVFSKEGVAVNRTGNRPPKLELAHYHETDLQEQCDSTFNAMIEPYSERRGHIIDNPDNC
jgi:hypothetical protein